MSDDPATFMRKTEAMIAKCNADLEAIAKRYVVNLASKLVITTPGPNLQLPETQYIAKGQLRGGWSVGLSQITPATVWDGGPEDEDGAATIATIEAQLESFGPVQPHVYIQNNVAYGVIVHDGRTGETHAMPPRRWVHAVSKETQALADKAREEAMGR